MGGGRSAAVALCRQVNTADFSGGRLPIPPGVVGSPTWRPIPPGSRWVSPLVDGPLQDLLLDQPVPHLSVDGATVWVDDGTDPGLVVVSQPNRHGVLEDLGQSILRGRRLLVGVDPLLIPVISIPPGAELLSGWEPDRPTALGAAAKRSLLAADALRRRIQQIPGVLIATSRKLGRSFPLIVPVEPEKILEHMREAGAIAGTAAPEIPGGMVVSVGWWHTRQQLDAYAAALRSIVAGQIPAPIPPDVYLISDDLPLRRLTDTMRQEEVR